VPSCPGWTTGRLPRHVGDVQRWAGATVRSRATGPPPVEHSGDLPSGLGDDPPVLGSWLAEGAAALAAGAEYDVDPDVALDAIDEGLELGSLPAHFRIGPRLQGLLGPGRTLHFHATDISPEAGAEWLVDLTGDAAAWRRAHEKAAVVVRGPLSDLLLIIYKRRPARGGGIEVSADAAVLDYWLERVSFG
jgi:hypothetical protein